MAATIPKSEVEAFLEAVLDEVVKREQAKATPPETMFKMLDEIFKKPAPPTIQKLLQEAS